MTTPTNIIPENETRSQTVERLARQAHETQVKKETTVDGRELIFVDGDKVSDKRASDAPEHHIRATVQVSTVPSFLEYLSTFHQEGSVVFVSPDGVSAVLDGDTPDKPGAGDHKLRLVPRRASQMQALEAMSNKWIERAEFAEKLHRLKREIVAPPMADAMALVQQLNITKKIDFSGGERLADGQRVLRYVEEQTATGGGSQEIAIPETVDFELAYYQHGNVYPVSTEFRYRLRGTEVELQLSFPYWDEVRQQVTDDLRETLIREIGDVLEPGLVPVFDA